MRIRKLYYAKIVVSQVLAFFIASLLLAHVFTGPLPVVKADFIRTVKSSPQRIMAAMKEIPDTIGGIARSSIPGGGSGGNNSQVQVPAPYIFSSGPTPLPTIARVPTQAPAPTEASPQPTSIIRLPDIPGIPTTPPRPTQRPQPTSVPQQPTQAQPPPAGGSGAGGSPGGSGGSGQQSQYPGNQSLEQQTVDEINRRRSQLGLQTLSINSHLTQAARRHSADMSEHKMCGHQGTDGTGPFERVAKTSYSGRAYGETVACWARTPLQAVDGWWGSPPHYAILTHPSIREIGLGWVNTHQTAVVGY